MISNDLINSIDKFLNIYTEDKLISFIEDEIESYNTNVLTIISNSGIHRIPDRFIRGEVYIASSGNIDFTNTNKIIKEYNEILAKLKPKLLEKEWRKIYLVPTGHPTLSLQIKSFVYHILRIDTIDLFYSNGEYHDIKISHRDIS